MTLHTLELDSIAFPKRWGIVPEYSQRFFDLADWSAIFADPRPYIVVEKLRRLVLYVPLDNQKHSGVYIKIFRLHRKRDRLRLFLQRSMGAKEFYISKLLQRKGIRTPPVLAYANLSANPIANHLSVFVSFEVENARPLGSYIKGDTDISQELRSSLLRQYGELIATLHKNGLYARDMHMNNVLVRENDGGHDCFLLDFESTRLFSGWLPRKRLLDLGAALYGPTNPSLSKEQLATVLKSYLASMHNQSASTRACDLLHEKLICERQKLLARRRAKTAARPYHTRKVGDLTVRTRRDVECSAVIRLYKQLVGNFENQSALVLGSDLICDVVVPDTGREHPDFHSARKLLASIEDARQRNCIYLMESSHEQS